MLLASTARRRRREINLPNHPLRISFKRGAKTYRPTIATLKASLKELGVIDSDAVGAGTPPMSESERREFSARFAALRERNAEMLERGWVSEYDSPAGHAPATERKSAGRNG